MRIENARYVGIRVAFNRSSAIPHIPTIATSGEYILATMPLGLLVDHFSPKGGYTPDELLTKVRN